MLNMDFYTQTGTQNPTVVACWDIKQTNMAQYPDSTESSESALSYSAHDLESFAAVADRVGDKFNSLLDECDERRKSLHEWQREMLLRSADIRVFTTRSSPLEEIRSLYNSERRYAVEELKKFDTRDDKYHAHKTAFGIFKNIYHTCQCEVETQKHDLTSLLQVYPLPSGTSDGVTISVKHFEDMKATRILREIFQQKNKLFERNVYEHCRQTLPELKNNLGTDTKLYVKKCITISLYNISADAPYVIDFERNVLYDDTRHEPLNSKLQLIEQRVDLVWPVLSSPEKQTTIDKGKAVPHIKQT